MIKNGITSIESVYNGSNLVYSKNGSLYVQMIDIDGNKYNFDYEALFGSQVLQYQKETQMAKYEVVPPYSDVYQIKEKSHLRSVQCGKKIIEIGDNSFINCTSLSSVMCHGVKIIGSGSFDATKIKYVDCPIVETIGQYAFSRTEKATLILSAVTAVPTIQYSLLTPSIGSDTIVIVPSALVKNFRTATNWSSYYERDYCTFKLPYKTKDGYWKGYISENNIIKSEWTGEMWNITMEDYTKYSLRFIENVGWKLNDTKIGVIDKGYDGRDTRITSNAMQDIDIVWVPDNPF